MRPGWRKFTLSFIGIIAAFVLAFAEKLTGDFVTIVTICVGTYNAANAYAKRVRANDNSA